MTELKVHFFVHMLIKFPVSIVILGAIFYITCNPFFNWGTEDEDDGNSDDMKKNSVVLSPLANYTDRAIAAGQRS
jgi:hypothetical protein